MPVVGERSDSWVATVVFAGMRISERVDNAVRAMGVLADAAQRADREPTAVKAEAIAAAQSMSTPYLFDILRDLKRAELVRSKRGPDGGFVLSRPADEISLADVFRAVDGPLADVHDESLRSLSYPPPVDALPTVWMAVRGGLRQVLETVTVADLIASDLPEVVVELADEYRRTTAERHG